MTTKITLQTQTNLQQQSNVEVPNDAYIVFSNTANQNFIAYVDQKIIWNTTILNYRCTRTGSDFTVPENGWYMIALDIWWAGNAQVHYYVGLSTGSGIAELPATTTLRANTGSFAYLQGNIPLSIYAQSYVTQASNYIYGRPYCKIKKIR